MPIDKYIKQAQKTKLWAHRRNNTAQKQLNGRLRHFEQDYERNCRQYLRTRIRIQAELRDLEALPSFDDAKNDDVKKTVRVSDWNGSPFPASTWRSTRHGVNSKKNEDSHLCYRNSVPSTPTSLSTQTPTSFSTQTPSRNTSSKLSMSRCRSSVSVHATDGRMQATDQKISTPSTYSLPTSIGHRAPRETSDVDTKFSRSLTQFSNTCSDIENLKTPDNAMTTSNLMSKSSESLCKYIETRSAARECSYFPCKVPETYHTLGYRREDLCAWTNDSSMSRSDVMHTPCPVDAPVHLRILPNGKLVYLETCSNSRDTPYSPEQAQTSRNAVYPKWCKDKSVKVFKFQETEGPLFNAKPRDPILEQIRSGATKALEEPRCTTRTTVRAKIRGLKQLVTEMRARNESTRPVDWAVNYGAKMPTRLLLNPVFPVGDG